MMKELESNAKFMFDKMNEFNEKKVVNFYSQEIAIKFQNIIMLMGVASRVELTVIDEYTKKYSVFYTHDINPL